MGLPEWAFFSYLGLSFGSLVISFFLAQWYRVPAAEPSHRAVSAVIAALVAPVILMVPIFYLVYIGMTPRGHLLLNLLLPPIWAHLAAYGWAVGHGFWERYTIGLSLLLALPAIYLGFWVDSLLGLRFGIPLLHWLLLLTGIILWVRMRVERGRS